MKGRAENAGQGPGPKALLPLAVAVFAVCAGSLHAQTFSVLHTFSKLGSPTLTNMDGAEPVAGLTPGDGRLYGVAQSGGTNSNGTIFSINTDGSGFNVLHTFSPSAFPEGNGDGSGPSAPLTLIGGTLYGTTGYGGTNSDGTVFSMGTNGSNFQPLHEFVSSTEGQQAKAPLLYSGGVLYGSTEFGGSNIEGGVFSLGADGSDFTVLYAFSYNAQNDNPDGADPEGSLALVDGTLFGIADDGGTNGTGTIFSISTGGTNFTVLHTFGVRNLLEGGTNADGASPTGGLISSGDTLYGTAYWAGTNGAGTIFSVDISGSNFTVLHNFIGTDGANPAADLVLSGGVLYGTTEDGGATGFGTVFSVNTNGSGFTVLHSFSAVAYSTNSDGAFPLGRLVLANNVLYGTTSQGGTNGSGTIFSVTVPSQLLPPIITGIVLTNSSVVINATNGAAGGTYTLLASTNLAPPIGLWTPIVTNTLSASGSFAITATNPFVPPARAAFYVLRAH